MWVCVFVRVVTKSLATGCARIVKRVLAGSGLQSRLHRVEDGPGELVVGGVAAHIGGADLAVRGISIL